MEKKMQLRNLNQEPNRKIGILTKLGCEQLENAACMEVRKMKTNFILYPGSV